MFLPFFEALRREAVPASLREYLSFLEGLNAGIVIYDLEGFYFFARSALVKDERHFDRFDRAFSASFKGVEDMGDGDVIRALDLPPEWLEKLLERQFDAKEKAALQSLGGFEALMQALRDRLAEQQGRHQGGNKWIGTAGTSPFGAHGYNPQGVRIGQQESRHQRAVKVWDQRVFRNLDEQAELGGRNMKIALRRLRRWARSGAAEELDLEGTIQLTARNGWLDVQTRPERRNAVKVLLFLDVGGSMDPHVHKVQELFSAARAEFKNLEFFYFHNCLYEALWRDNARRWEAKISTMEILRRYGSDYKAIFVGDAAMSPYEVAAVGGANEHWNPEPGSVWLQRACAQWPSHLWINPVPISQWPYAASTAMIQDIMGQMVPLTVEGISQGIKVLR